MVKSSKAPNPFTGRWRIVSMEQWDQDYVDEEEEGYFEFTDKGWGQFHFGYVHGQMDCRLTRQGRRASRRMVLGRQRRDGRRPGPGLGGAEGRRVARHDPLPRR
jgi:hypothetical protein